MQLIRTYFENKEPKIRAQIVGFSNANTGIGLIGYNEDRVMYSTPLQLFSGVNNPVKISCLNSDQKRINVSNVNIQCGLFVPNTQNELITANATNIDSANGIVEIIFTPSQLAPLDFGLYEVALTATDANLNCYPIYIDDNYNSRLTTRLSKGPVLAYDDPIPLSFTDTVDVGVVSNNIDLTQRPMNSTTATVCANLIAYTGNIIGQGSLVTIPFPNDWGNVSSSYYANVTGLVFQNMIGSFALARFVIEGIDPHGYGNVSPSNIALYINGANIRI